MNRLYWVTSMHTHRNDVLDGYFNKLRLFPRPAGGGRRTAALLTPSQFRALNEKSRKENEKDPFRSATSCQNRITWPLHQVWYAHDHSRDLGTDDTSEAARMRIRP